MSRKVSVVIPVYNEEDILNSNISAILNVMHSVDLSYELIMVDDGSTDESWEMIEKLCENYESVFGIKLSRNFGKEAALASGLKEAKGDCVIVMDADLQHPPEKIPEMISLWREGYEVIQCLKGSRGKEGFFYRCSTKIFYCVINKLSGFNFQGASDYKLLDRKAVDAWSHMLEYNTFFRGMIEWVGFKKKDIHFDVGKRVGGKTKFTFLKLVKLAVDAITSYTTFPLYVISALGFIFLFGALGLAVQTLIRQMMGNSSEGFPTVILLQLIIGSSVMLSLGVIGIYIAKIYQEVKKRPRYIVSKRTERVNEKD